MAVHHDGKIGKAGKTLASKSSSKSAKSKAEKTCHSQNENALIKTTSETGGIHKP